MSSYRRNILVGAVVLTAGGIFVWMVLKFSTKTAELFAPPQVAIHFSSDRADGLSDGSAVYYLGVNVGQVTDVKRTTDGLSVIINATLVRQPPIPANLLATIAQTNPIGGGTSVNLRLDGDKPVGELQPDANIEAKYVGLQMNFLPPEFNKTAEAIGAMSEEARLELEEMRKSNVIPHLNDTIQELTRELSKAGETLTSVQSVLGDPKFKDDVQTAMAKIRSSTDKLDALMGGLQENSKEISGTLQDARQHMDDLSKQLGDRLTQLSTVMDDVQSIAGKLNKGKGSAGQIINDPKLYESLVDSARELNATVADLHRLIDQWEQEGVSMHLSK